MGSQTLRWLTLHGIRKLNWRKTKIGLHSVESDSAQVNTARSQTNFFGFCTSPSPGNLESICGFFKIFLKIQNWLTLRGVRLHAGYYCAELDSEQTNTAQSQQMSFSENPKVANTVRSQSFAVIKFVSAGLSLPWKRILIFSNICEHLQPIKTFFASFASLSKKCCLRAG